MKKIKALTAIGLTAAMLLTACGSQTPDENTAEESSRPVTEENTEGSESTDIAEESAETSPPLAGDTIKIGIYTPLTGASAEVGTNITNNLELAVDEINEAGGICGKPVELVFSDSQNDAKQAVQITQSYIEDESILAIITGGNSTCDLASAPYCQDAGLVLLASMSSNAALTPVGDYIFSIAGRSTAETPAAIKVCTEYYGDTKLAVFYENSEWGVGVNDLALEVAGDYGAEIVDSEQFSADETDYSAILSKARNAGTEAIIIVSQYAAAGNIVNQIKDMGWDVDIAGTPAVANKNFADLVGENGNGVVCFASMAFSDSYPRSMEYYDKFYGRYNVAPTNHAAAYEALTLLAQAANTCGDNLSRETLRDAIASVKDFQGLNGDFSIEEDGNITRNYPFVELKDGAWIYQ